MMRKNHRKVQCQTLIKFKIMKAKYIILLVLSAIATFSFTVISRTGIQNNPVKEQRIEPSSAPAGGQVALDGF